MSGRTTGFVIFSMAVGNVFAQETASDTARIQASSLVQIAKHLKSERLHHVPDESVTQPEGLVIGWDDPDEVLTITDAYTLHGDLTIAGRGVLNLQDADFVIDGDILITNEGRLNVTGGSFTVVQEYIYEHDAVVAENGRAFFSGVDFQSSGQSWSIAVAGTATYGMDASEVSDGFITAVLLDEAEADISDTQTPGEFLCMGENNIAFNGCDFLLFWIVLPDSSIVEASLPDDLDAASWTFSDDEPGVDAIPYSVRIDSCTNMMWGLISVDGSQAAFRDTEFRTIGLMFRSPDSTTVSNITNDSHHIDDTINAADRTLRLIDCDVQTWNFYPTAESNVTFENCIFGEVLTQENARATVINSVCDGTGGYFGAFQNSFIVVLQSYIQSQVITHDSTVLVAAASAFTGSEVDADQSSVMLIINTPMLVEPEAHASSIIFETRLPPVEGPVDAVVPIPGTMRILSGPENPIELVGYKIEYSAATDPPIWYATDGFHTESVHDDVLASWNTSGLSPGGYGLRLTFWHSFGDSLSVDSWARLDANTFVATAARIPIAFALGQNYPNPFNAETIIPFSLPEAAGVRLRIYNLQGREISTIVDGPFQMGEHSVRFDAGNLPSGVYFYRLQADTYSETRRFVLFK